MYKSLGKSANMTPLPVLIIATFNDDGSANAMNAAWGSQYDTSIISICLSAHKTTDNLKKRKAFTVSFATKSTVMASDYFGIESGRKVNKIEKAGYHFSKAPNVDAPLLEEYPLTLECEVENLEGNDKEGYMLYGKVVNVLVKEEYLKDGKVDVEKLELIAFCSLDGSYRLMGEKVADAFRVGLPLKK